MKNLPKAANYVKAVLRRELQFQFEMVPVSVRRPSLRQMTALASTEIDRIFPKPTLHSLPSVIQIEPTNYCNLKCPLCPSGRRALSRPAGFMSLKLFHQLLDEAGSALSLIVLWGWGEPLLHPELPEMIRMARRRNISVIVSTNGQQMNSRIASELVESGLNSIVVAMDGATEESYGSYRVGGSINKVLETLDLLYEAKQKTGSSLPHVNLRMVVTKQNEHEIELVREIAHLHGVDMFSLRGVAMTDLWDDETDESYVPDDSSRSMYRYSDQGRIKSSVYVCRRPWKRATIFWDGSIVPCEMDYSGSTSYGAFPDDGPFSAIWNGSRARAFRQEFLEDRLQFEFCARCPFNDRVTEDCTIERLEVRR